jgi:hypothetical protein
MSSRFHATSRRSAAAVVLGALLGLGVLGSSLPVAAATAAKSSVRSSEAILEAAEKATGNAASFTCRGTAMSQHTNIKIDVAVGRSMAGGTLQYSGNATTLIRRIFLLVYAKATQAFLMLQGMSHDQAELLSNHWFEIPSSDARDYNGLAIFLSPKSLAQGLLPPVAPGDVTSSRRSSLNGQPVYVIGGTFAHLKATMYVAAQGRPYVLRIVEPSRTDGGTINFTDYGKPVKLGVPKNVISGPSSGGTST